MKAINIKWDTDGDLELLHELPTEMEIPEGMSDEDEISDWLSDEEGFCHNGFDLDYDDFREYIPSVYYEKYLDFDKYPLKY